MVKEFDKEIKAQLPEGIWQDEPDYQYWVDKETGLDCLIVRQPNSGHLCGYVGVSKDHPLFGVNYSDCSLPEARVPNAEETADHILNMMHFNITKLKQTEEKAMESVNFLTEYWKKRKRCSEEYCSHTPESMFSVHGGLTYSDECNEKICHKTDNGDHVWWFGFDCAHSGDKSMFTKVHEAMNLKFSNLHKNDVYRDINYVMSECRSLAKQIHEYRKIKQQSVI